MEMKRTDWWKGIVVFVVAMLVLIFAAAPIQMALGMAGVAITELLLLAVAIVATLVLKQDLRTVFPIKKPRLRQVIGSVLMPFGSMLLVVGITTVIFYLYPQGMQVGETMGNLYQSAPFFVTWLVISVMPAICEEALHRGIILRTFSGVRSKTAVLLSMGFIFGLFHLDPVRFLPTAILGVLLTWLSMESGNILLPVLFHLSNNTVSVLSSLLPTSALESTAAEAAGVGIPLFMVGIYLILSAFGLLLIRLFCRLIKPKSAELNAVELEERARSLKRSRRWTAVAFIAFVAAGVACFAAEMPEMMELAGLL